MANDNADFGRIARYSVGHGADPMVLPGETVVLLPQPAQGEVARSSDIRLREAFTIAERLLREGRRVRVVATGASLRDSWPEWVGGATGLITTELGAYRSVHPIIATRALARDAHDWLRRIAGHPSPDDGISEKLYASLVSRVLQPLFEAVAYAQGLVGAHPGAAFHCVDGDWVGLDYLRALAVPNGSAVVPSAPIGTSRWRGRLAARLGWRLLLAVAGQLRRYVRSAPSRSALRQRQWMGGSPRLWLALQPDWSRINRHVLRELDAARTDYGVLLTTTLVPGDTTQPGRAGPLWPGIPDDLIDASSVPLDQVAGPENVASLVGGLIRGIRASLGAAWRLLKGDDGFLTLAGGLRGRAADGVARVLTIDLIQTVVIGDAVHALARRHTLRGSAVVFANLNLTDTATADRALRDAGAFTVDFRHGSGGGGWFGMHESFADHVLVWSTTDLALTDMLSRPASTTSPPAPPAPPAPTPATPIRQVLVVTGYSHDCWSLSGFPLRPFEIELLRGVELLWRQDPRYEIRWRPHPSDDPGEVAARLARFSFLARSQTADLAGDLAWADLVISYGGTTLGEAARAGVPVIVHVAPDLLAYPDVAAVPMGRSFFYATQLPGVVARLVEARDGDPAAAAADDRRLFDALFAPTAATVKGLDFSTVAQPARAVSVPS